MVQLGVEAHAERVAEAVGPDLADGARRGDERIARRDAVVAVGGVVAEGIDAQDLAEDGREVLGVAGRSVPDDRAADERLAVLVVGAAAVAEADVEADVDRREPQRAAVVIELRLVDAQELARAQRVDDRRRIGRIDDVPLGDDALVIGRASVGGCVEKSAAPFVGSEV